MSDLGLNLPNFEFLRLSKQNSKLRIHSKPDRNQSKLSVCTTYIDCVGYNLGERGVLTSGN